jgi:hypothetical protein
MKTDIVATSSRALLALAIAAGSVSSLTSAPGRPASTPTFTKDVAPILFDNCATCHRTGEIAPMTLLSYEDARPWAKAIKNKVVSREMPPWHADPQYGKFRNDRSLTRAQIDTIVAWVDGGAPKGDDADLPPLPKFPSGWQHGEPDYVIEMPVAMQIPAEGELDVQYLYQPVPFDEDRFAEVLEIRPSNPKVMHHGGVYIVDLPEGVTLKDGRVYGANGKELSPSEIRGGRGSRTVFDEPAVAGSTKLISFVPGRGLERHRPGTGKRIPAGKYIQWNLHYQPSGKPETDRTKLGIWFNKVPVTHEVLTRQAGDSIPTAGPFTPSYIVNGVEVPLVNGRARIPNIPPYAENWKIVGITPVTEPITLYGMSPHMHLRGQSLQWIVTWPDGRDEIVLSVPKYDFNWQIHYELETPLRIPAGSKITGVAFYDNSLKNKYNPGPEKEVFWSEQSWDEMYQAFTEYTIDSQDLTRKPTTTAQPPRRPQRD